MTFGACLYNKMEETPELKEYIRNNYVMGPLILEHKTNEAGGLDFLLFDVLVRLPEFECDPAFRDAVKLPRNFSTEITNATTSFCHGFNKQLIITSCPSNIMLRQYSGHPIPEWVFQNYNMYSTYVHKECEKEIKRMFYGQERRSA